MGLDAVVYCNCFRIGKLHEPPVAVWGVYVEEDGSVAPKTEILEEQIAFDEWLNLRACEHPGGVFLHHRLGNIALIALLRAELSRSAMDFPVLLKQVLYDGMHGGDYLSQEDVDKLRPELDKLKSFKCTNSEVQSFVDDFRQQMEELVECARIVDNPIAF